MGTLEALRFALNRPLQCSIAASVITAMAPDLFKLIQSLKCVLEHEWPEHKSVSRWVQHAVTQAGGRSRSISLRRPSATESGGTETSSQRTTMPAATGRDSLIPWARPIGTVPAASDACADSRRPQTV